MPVSPSQLFEKVAVTVLLPFMVTVQVAPLVESQPLQPSKEKTVPCGSAVTVTFLPASYVWSPTAGLAAPPVPASMVRV